eukprot:10704713-Karenia_brevis.AAC.1
MAAKSKDNPIGSPDNRKQGKFEESGPGEDLMEVEGMPGWAVAMQTNLMKHTSQEIAGLRREVDETRAMAMEAQEDIRSLRKDLEQ